jgi:predicted aspartyl protease
MGKVIVKLKLTNQVELFLRDRAQANLTPRSVEIQALVDTGATRLYLKPSVISALGLQSVRSIQSRTTNGDRLRQVYDPVRLELMGRSGIFEVLEVDEAVPNLLGQIPLEDLDFIVDPRGQRLLPNPEHGDKQMSEEY